MKIVHLDVCSQIKYDDMAQAWLGTYDPLFPPLGRVLIGWKGFMAFTPEADWDTFSYNIWYSLGVRKTNFYWALQYALDNNNESLIVLSNGFIGDSDNMTSFP